MDELLNKVHCMDCIEFLRKIPDDSVDACVTDPPYGLEFMGKEWDNLSKRALSGYHNSATKLHKECDGYGKKGRKAFPAPIVDSSASAQRLMQQWHYEWAVEVFRVLKPGAHLLAFSGTRTYHRLACAIEDAGFEIRDQIHWLYGCLSEDTEILVNDEWRTYKELREGDRVLGYDVESGSLCWQPIQEVVRYDYDDIAYRIKSERTDQLVSKNHHCVVELDEDREGLVFAEQLPKSGAKMRYLRQAVSEILGSCKTKNRTFLFPSMQWNSERAGLEETWSQGQSSMVRRNRETIPSEHKRVGKPSLEGGSDLQAFQGQLRRPEVRQMPSRVSINGEEGRLRDGTQVDCGSGNWQMLETVRGSPSYRPRHKKQLDRELDVVLKQSSTQTLREARFTSTTMARVETVHYKGIMWCIKVPTGAFVARRNGLIFVTGNSGFPKGQNISKFIDKKVGKGKTVRAVPSLLVRPKTDTTIQKGRYADPTRPRPNSDNQVDRTFHIPETEEAKQWQGWNTQLKPAHEPIVFARKPISEKSIVENVLTHGTGAINIDACRIAVNPDVDAVGRQAKRKDRTKPQDVWFEHNNPDNRMAGVLPSGRYPANLILSHHPDCKLVHKGQTTMKMDSVEANVPLMGGKGIYGGLEGTRTVQRYADEPEVWACVEGCPVRVLNEQSGERPSGKSNKDAPVGESSKGVINPMRRGTLTPRFDSGGAARFFYCAKPSPADVAGVHPSGRYPANLILSHHPDCKQIRNGKTIITDKSSQDKEPKMGKDGIYGQYHPETNIRTQYDDEPEVWACVEGCPVRILNEQSKGMGRSPRMIRERKPESQKWAGRPWTEKELTKFEYGDKGGAARFFYCAKPSVAERNAGMNGSRNIHITVKPLSVMRWLVKLVTRRGGVVLDPFLGSGTTAIAAENEGCDWLACDNNEEYCEIAEARIEALGGTQTTLEDFK